jgi:uncharacterized repeat protein (TIGR02543 family)
VSDLNYPTEPNKPLRPFPAVPSSVLPLAIVPTFNVIYDGNGNTGGLDPIDPINHAKGSNTAVLGFFTLVKDDSSFVGWNTEADGSGTSFAVGAGLTVMTNMTLYAQWTSAVIVTSETKEQS